MEFGWTVEQVRLRDEARAFARDAVERFGRSNDSWINGYSREVSRELGARGWIGMGWPKQYGGGDRPPLDRLIVAEELITAGAPVGASWFADRQMGPALIAYGSEEQRQRYLPLILSGETTWCIGMSEPDAGSDLASLQTSAVRDGADYVINGQKIWTSFGEVADYCYLICRTSADCDTSQVMNLLPALISRRSRSVAAPNSAFTSTTITVASSAASRMALARPMPVAPPVTIATLSLKRPDSAVIVLLHSVRLRIAEMKRS